MLLLSCLSGCAPSIHDLVARGKVDTVSNMLQQAPRLVDDRDGKDKTPLHKAVTYKQPEMMALLTTHGADVNSADKTGMTPLHVAAMLGRREEAEWLLEQGADPLIEDTFGDTPFHTAAIFGHGHIIGLLAAWGVSPDRPNGAGETAREIASTYRQERVVQYITHLLKKS